MKLAAPSVDPVVAFAREALARRLVTREQAEECVSAARALARQGKKAPIEQVFLSKGYLSRGDARALAARTRPAPAALDLVPEERRRECPACARDPGLVDDCRHCGADVATGAPGPNSIACACGQVLLRGTALCTRCAAPIARPARRHDTSYGPFLGRVAVLAGVAGVAYFLVWRPLHADAGASGSPDEGPVVERAATLLEEGQTARALTLLEQAVEGDDGEHDERLRARRALALAARSAGRPDQARAVARGALARGEDPALRVLLAEVALDAGQLAEAKAELNRVPAARRDDPWRRAESRRRSLAGEDPVEPLAALSSPSDDDRLALAVALSERALARARTPDAGAAVLADVERARALAGAPAGAGAPVLLRCGLAQAALGRHREALQDLEAARRAAPGDAGVHLARGVSLEALADRAGAAAAYREFLRLAGQEPAQRERAARVQARLDTLR